MTLSDLENAGGGAGGAAPTEGAPNVTPAVPAADGQGDGGSAQGGLSPEVQAAIDKAVQGVRAEYEGKGGHIAKLKSKYDKQLAQLQQAVEGQQRADYEAAMAHLEGGDYRTAATILAEQVDQLQGSRARSAQEQEVASWVGQVMTDLGYDLEGSEEDAAFAGEWVDKMLENPEYSWEFQQTAAKRQLDAARAEAAKAKKDLDGVVSTLDQTVRAEVTKILASAGLAPEPTGEEGTRPSEDWRSLPTGKLLKLGLEERKKKPIQR